MHFDTATSAPCDECGGTGITVVLETEGDPTGAYTVTCDDCPAEFYVPAEAKSRDRITALRTIVRDHSAKRIDGYVVDAMTAGMLVAVYDALSPENRERFGKPNLLKLVDLGWKSVRS